jgi:hypothetical protein
VAPLVRVPLVIDGLRRLATEPREQPSEEGHGVWSYHVLGRARNLLLDT